MTNSIMQLKCEDDDNHNNTQYYTMAVIKYIIARHTLQPLNLITILISVAGPTVWTQCPIPCVIRPSSLNVLGGT